jgi:SAM-dependent methyltransferase
MPLVLNLDRPDRPVEPRRIGAAGDGITAAEALARVRRGETLVYAAGDYHNARQLLAAMARRLERGAPGGSRPSGGRRGRPAAAPSSREAAGPAALAERFRAERATRALAHEVLGRLVVPLAPMQGRWSVPLRRAPDVAAACEEVLGPPREPALLALRDLLGLVGAHEWRRRGVEVPALGARVHPHHGVYAPVRGEYVDLVAEAAARWPPAGKAAFDVGTGTGVLAFVLARAGASVVATDREPRAVACARENAARLGLAAAVEVVEADLFPPGEADVVVSNPPWIPADAHSALERAVYDPGGAFLERLVLGLPTRLRPGGEGWVVLSDLAERLGLRAAGHVEALAARAGLAVADRLERRPAHPRAADRADPLHAARAAEVTRVFRLVRA